jgi:hypothetical protein
MCSYPKCFSVSVLLSILAWFGSIGVLQAETTIASGEPLVVTVNGHRYPIAVVRIRDKKQIVLSSKHEFGKFADVKLTINFNNTRLTQLSGQRLRFTGKDFSKPSVLLHWMKPGKSLPTSIFITKDYDLSLVFGRERDFRIPLEISFKTREGANVTVVGTQLAKTSDLVVVNGKVDRHQDNIDTVMYVAARFIQRVDKLANLPQLKDHGYALSMPGSNEKPDPNPKRVYSSTELKFDFTGARGKEQGDFQMVRDRSGWQVYRVLAPARLRSIKQADLSLDTLFMYDAFIAQAVDRVFGKAKVKTWKSKNKMLQNTNVDPKKNKDQYGIAAYRVTLKDGSQHYVKLLAKKQGLWKISKILNGAQVVQAHMDKRKNKRHWSSDVQKHLAAVRLEKELNQRYAHLQIRATNFSCGVSKLWTDCKATWYRLVNAKEQCEGTKYLYRRKDDKSPWQFVRELAADEKLDHRDGQVKKMPKPSKYFCW